MKNFKKLSLLALASAFLTLPALAQSGPGMGGGMGNGNCNSGCPCAGMGSGAGARMDPGAGARMGPGAGARMGPGAGAGMGPGAGARMGPGMGAGMRGGRNQRSGQNGTPGWALMSPEERTTFLDQMRSVKTHDECVSVQTAHRAVMELRAKEKGVELPLPRQNRCDMMQARGVIK